MANKVNSTLLSIFNFSITGYRTPIGIDGFDAQVKEFGYFLVGIFL